jgi:hypothetical protein
LAWCVPGADWCGVVSCFSVGSSSRLSTNETLAPGIRYPYVSTVTWNELCPYNAKGGHCDCNRPNPLRLPTLGAATQGRSRLNKLPHCQIALFSRLPANLLRNGLATP